MSPARKPKREKDYFFSDPLFLEESVFFFGGYKS